MNKLLLISTAAVLAYASAQAQTNSIFNNAGGDNLWSNSANWVDNEIADTNSERVQLNASPIVDQNFTISRIQSNFGAAVDAVVSGSGTLTLDASSGNAYGIFNNSNNGINMRFSGSVAVNHGSSGITNFGYSNGTGNAITFDSGSTLQLNSAIQTETGATQFLNFNGNITGGTPGVAGIRIASGDSNVIFGSTANNSGYAGDIVFFNNSEVISNTTVANGFLNTGSKIQVNGSGGSLTLDGAGGMGGNVVIGANNSFTLNANADQAAMGFLNINNGSALTIALGASTSEFAFASSASIDWGTGLVSITGFKENTVRFGTDASSLTQAQLDSIDGGIYSLTDQGYLSVPEPGAYALIFGVLVLGLSVLRRR